MTKLCLIALISLSLISAAISVLCRDGTRCPGDMACCLTVRGDVSCCPYVDGTCCWDGYHCCPSYTRCTHFFECVGIGNEFLQISANLEKTLEPEQKVNSLEQRIEFALKQCVKDGDLEQKFNKTVGACKNKNLEENTKCYFALLEIINKGQIRSIECYDNIKSIMDILKNN